MKSKAAFASVLLLLFLAGTHLSAQAFFTSRAQGTLEVRFLPPAGGQLVQVSIDDQLAGTLPLTVYVVPGPHKFTFFAGDESKSLTYPVRGDVVVPSIFTPTGFSLTVNTNVPGASLAVDGHAFAGNTTTVSPGNHTLTVNAPGYQSLTLPFSQPRQANVLNITLISSTFPLTVNTNVPGASLAVDGVAFAGNNTAVTPGSHTLTVSAPGYQSLTLPFTQPSQANILNITLIASTGTVQVDTGRLPRTGLPYSVFVDGGEVRGGLLTLMPGAHTVRVVSGNLSLETTVTVAAGQALTLTPSIQWELR